MKKLAVKEAETHFRELMDKVQREPVSIEKHGRPVAVIMSMKEYKAIEKIKLERLRTHLAEGEAQLDRGEGTDGESFFEEILNENA